METTDAGKDETERQKQLIETRRAEAMALFTSAQAYNVRNDQLVAIGLTLIGVAVTLGLKQNLEEVLVGVPAALALLLIYALQIDADVRVMGVARQGLEEAINGQLDAPGLIYQSRVIQFRRGSYIRGVMWVRKLLLVVAMPSTAIGGAFAAYHINGWVLAAYVPIVVALVACLWRAYSDWEEAEREAKNALTAGALEPSPKDG